MPYMIAFMPTIELFMPNVALFMPTFALFMLWIYSLFMLALHCLCHAFPTNTINAYRRTIYAYHCNIYA